MKKFILNQIVGDKLTKQDVIQIICSNAYQIDDFGPYEHQRVGFTSVHQKLDHLYIDGNGYVCASFRIATKSVNKKIMKDLVKQRVKENKERGITSKVKDIEEAVENKLKETADIKIKSIDLIFDIENELIYCSGTESDFDIFFKKVMKSYDEEIKVRTFKPKFNKENMGLFFTEPNVIPDGFNTGSYAEIEIDDEIYIFKNVDIKSNQEFEKLTENKFFVNGMDLILHDNELSCKFKLNKKGMPIGINASVIESSAMLESESMGDFVEEHSKGKTMSKEEKLFDLLYTNSIILIDALGKVADFTFDLNQFSEFEVAM